MIADNTFTTTNRTISGPTRAMMSLLANYESEQVVAQTWLCESCGLLHNQPQVTACESCGAQSDLAPYDNRGEIGSIWGD